MTDNKQDIAILTISLTGLAAKHAKECDASLTDLNYEKRKLTTEEQITLYRMITSYQYDELYSAFISTVHTAFVRANLLGENAMDILAHGINSTINQMADTFGGEVVDSADALKGIRTVVREAKNDRED